MPTSSTSTRMDDPIQVHENHAGPIRNTITLPNGLCIAASLNFNFIAYRDAEADSAFYGFGGTPEEAVADYLRQICEEECSNCDTSGNSRDGCIGPDDCCLSEANFTRLVKLELDYMEADTTHGTWRSLNTLTPKE